jgi:hypothetical protein
MKSMLPIFILCLFILSCSHKLQYIGRTYGPSSNVEIFFTPNDIPKDFEVMGKVQTPGTNRYQKMQVRIMDEAKKRGADAILISEVVQENSGLAGNSITTSNGMRTGKTWSGTSATIATFANLSYRSLYVDFIKYK